MSELSARKMLTASRMPTAYKAPLGLPFYWMNETLGELKRAVVAYLDNRVEGSSITGEQIDLVRDYLQHWVNAPCWNSQGFEEELQHLRSTVCELDTATKIQEWIFRALKIGMDPL